MTLLQKLEYITARYAESHRLAVAGFIARRPRPEVLELFDSNPGLGLLLAYSGQFCTGSDDPWNEAHTMILRPRNEILGWLGFPASKSAVRIVGKLDVARVTLDRCRKLVDLIRQDEVVVRLRHLPSISDGVIDILANSAARRRVSFSLLEEVCQRENDMEIAADLLDAGHLAELHGVRLQTFRNCDSVSRSAGALRLMERDLTPAWSSIYEDIVTVHGVNGKKVRVA